jgi:presenilin-like A22 family membrane protease
MEHGATFLFLTSINKIYFNKQHLLNTIYTIIVLKNIYAYLVFILSLGSKIQSP